MAEGRRGRSGGAASQMRPAAPAADATPLLGSSDPTGARQAEPRDPGGVPSPRPTATPARPDAATLAPPGLPWSAASGPVVPWRVASPPVGGSATAPPTAPPGLPWSAASGPVVPWRVASPPVGGSTTAPTTAQPSRGSPFPAQRPRSGPPPAPTTPWPRTIGAPPGAQANSGTVFRPPQPVPLHVFRPSGGTVPPIARAAGPSPRVAEGAKELLVPFR